MKIRDKRRLDQNHPKILVLIGILTLVLLCLSGCGQGEIPEIKIPIEFVIDHEIYIGQSTEELANLTSADRLESYSPEGGELYSAKLPDEHLFRYIYFGPAEYDQVEWINFRNSQTNDCNDYRKLTSTVFRACRSHFGDNFVIVDATIPDGTKLDSRPIFVWKKDSLFASLSFFPPSVLDTISSEKDPQLNLSLTIMFDRMGNPINDSNISTIWTLNNIGIDLTEQ